ncbi:hypothetical protein PFMALIP_03629 [Plasmodium falciparum MaliPS096_E11]|uniref:Uncharacterized protein n=1 Tax=Plasmodium falciparum MaliPS096_E11 TaxID=1036727 RepID=A0A024WM52_PLAFA|nr:hypothetical protein PFMALIP_03629 [Plasmodium falciparum MaliPS096_E11]
MMNNYMPKSFEEILVHPQNKLSILNFFTDIIKFNNDPILSKELEYVCNNKNTEECKTLYSLKTICVILGIQGSGKTTLIKYLCDKLNIRQCYYENEPMDYINNLRGMKERETDDDNDDDNSNKMNDNYYEHPYINFLLYSNCKIGNTKKDKTQSGEKRNHIIQNKKYIGKNAEHKSTSVYNNNNNNINYIDDGDDNAVNRSINYNDNYNYHNYNSMLNDKFSIGGKKRIVDSNIPDGPNKFVKISNSNKINYRGTINSSLSSNNHFNNNNNNYYYYNNRWSKEMIIEKLTECNNMIIQLIKLWFKLYVTYMNILKELFKYSESLGNEKKCTFPFFKQNRFYRIINKKFLLCVKIFKKINNILSVLHNLKDTILKEFNEFIRMEKQHLINLFVEGNYNEEMIEALNKLYHTNEGINITIKESNDMSFCTNKNLHLYNKLKVELNEEWDIRASLIEEMKDYIERKNMNKELEKYIESNNNIMYVEKENSTSITIPMINEENMNDFYIRNKYMNKNKYNNKNKYICRDSSTCTGSDDSTCLDNNSVKSTIYETESYITNILTNHTLNKYIEHFIEINKSKKVIKELCVSNNLKRNFNEHYLNIIQELNKSMNDLNNINYIEIKKGKINFPHFMILPKDIHDIFVKENKEKDFSSFDNENILIQLLMINNYNINFINNFNLKNIIKEVIIIHMLLIINIKDIIIINMNIVNHIKMDVINNLIMTNNLIKKKKKALKMIIYLERTYWIN